jgi:trk system potassium uptake protein TrkH
MAVVDPRPALFVVGMILALLCGAMLVAAFVAWIAVHQNQTRFVECALATGFVGITLLLGNRVTPVTLGLRQAFLLTPICWILVPAFGALPFMASSLALSFTDAYFEAVSGLTTTGSTVIVGLDQVPADIIVWRSILQWIGGIGIIVMAVAVLPFLHVGGMQLLHTESSDRSEKVLPRPGQIAGSISLIYFTLTMVCMIAYYAGGMTPFEAINMAMTTISTGGYAPTDASFGKYDSAALPWIGTLFMLSGALPFTAYVKSIQRRSGDVLRNSEVRLLCGLVATTSLALGTWIWLTSDMSFITALREATFNITSVVTTTGYSTTDYQTWGGPAIGLMLLLTVIGGCTGSTAGGIKMFRWRILFQEAEIQIRRLIYPHLVTPRSFERRTVSDDVVAATTSFVFLFILATALVAFILMALGLDPLTAVSGAATAFANVGPGLGQIIGPAGTFQGLSDAAKWLLAAGMILGRLEILTLLVLLHPSFWRS